MKCTLREWQELPKDIGRLIVQASSMNCDDAWMPFPIGMCFQYVMNYHRGTGIQIGAHPFLVLCAMGTSTDSRRRPTGINRESILNTIQQNGIQNLSLHHHQYFDALPQFKFIISPEGNGIDCHRHYEALIAGCIPICEKNPLIEEKYKGCPILYTTDYSEITPEYLMQKYDEMLDQTWDFSCLFLDHYSPETQTLIKQCGNFWLNRIDAVRRSWYA
jgi:hypothetical protein